MAAEADEIIRTLMTEFADVDDDTLDIYLEIVKPLVSRIRFKGMYQYALALLAAHKMKLAGLGSSDDASALANLSGVGGLASLSEGDTSVSFDTSWTSSASSDADTAEYMRTVYGLQFLSLRRQMIMSITIDGSGVRAYGEAD